MALRRYLYSMKHHWITDMQIGDLVPFFFQEVTPGDTWRGNSQTLFRLAPLEKPAYLQLNIYSHFFFMPYRELDENFTQMITQQIEYPTAQVPRIAAGVPGALTLPGYFGNGDGSQGYTMSAYAIRAYNACFNQYFNDPEHSPVQQDSVSVQRVLFPANNYFTGARGQLQQQSEVTVDSSGATIPVREIMDGQRLQRLKERRSQYGEEYEDHIRSLGVKLPMTSIGRPEHVARGKTIMGISEVTATASSTNETTGEYKGHGATMMNVRFPKRRFAEYGCIIGLMYARPRFQLKNNHPKIHDVWGAKHFYYPEFALDRQQPVYMGEVTTQAIGNKDDIWGYQARYQHLREAQDIIAGDMRADKNTPYHGAIGYLNLQTPSLEEVRKVQTENYEHLFQDNTARALNVTAYSSHAIGKRSIIPPRQR